MQEKTSRSNIYFKEKLFYCFELKKSLFCTIINAEQIFPDYDKKTRKAFMAFVKYLKTAIISLAIALGVTQSEAKETYTSDVSALPQEAISFLNNNFKGVNIIKIKIETGWIKKTTYDVDLENGVEIEFDKNGNWKEIDSKLINLPLSLLPKQLAEAVSKKVPDAKIESIERKGYGYKIELKNDVELLVYDDLRVIKSYKD